MSVHYTNDVNYTYDLATITDRLELPAKPRKVHSAHPNCSTPKENSSSRHQSPPTSSESRISSFYMSRSKSTSSQSREECQHASRHSQISPAHRSRQDGLSFMESTIWTAFEICIQQEIEITSGLLVKTGWLSFIVSMIWTTFKFCIQHKIKIT